MQTVAEALVDCLVEAGIDTVFGFPGGGNVEFLDAVRRKGMRFVLTHHESPAAFMASATARLSGRPAACLATFGPGATNALTGTGHAYLDRSPVIVITGQTLEELKSRNTHQVLDLEALFRPITKATVSLKPEGAVETVRNAVELARSGRPGPVHIGLSNDVAARPVVEGEGSLGIRANEPGLLRDADMLSEVEKAVDLLSRAKRPVICAGLGLEPERPYEELLTLAETAGAPVIVTPKAKGAISDEHPLSAGVIGLTRTDPVYEVLDEADLVLMVGFDVVELVRTWEHPSPVVWIAPWNNHDPVLPVEAKIFGAMKPVLTRLAGTPVSTEEGWGARRVADHRSKFESGKTSSTASSTASIAEAAADSSSETSPAGAGSGALTPRAVLQVLRDILPPETILTTDVGSHKIFYCLEWPSYMPNRFLVSDGLSSMGYGLPAAIAAGLLDPGSPVVCVTGDAGLLMILGELNTLARLDVPVTVVVFRDNALDFIRSHQNRVGKPTFGTEFAAPGFAGIAAAQGIQASRATDESTLAEALERYIDSERPALIEVEIDPAAYPTTPARNPGHSQ